MRTSDRTQKSCRKNRKYRTRKLDFEGKNNDEIRSIST